VERHRQEIGAALDAKDVTGGEEDRDKICKEGSMPIYEYRCRTCNATFEVLVRGNNAVTCPHCGGSSLDKLLSAPVMLSGQTARPAGRTCCGREERCDTPPCSEGGECRRG
jgi:putative FmdB family regulatory protein